MGEEYLNQEENFEEEAETTPPENDGGTEESVEDLRKKLQEETNLREQAEREKEAALKEKASLEERVSGEEQKRTKAQAADEETEEIRKIEDLRLTDPEEYARQKVAYERKKEDKFLDRLRKEQTAERKRQDTAQREVEKAFNGIPEGHKKFVASRASALLKMEGIDGKKYSFQEAVTIAKEEVKQFADEKTKEVMTRLKTKGGKENILEKGGRTDLSSSGSKETLKTHDDKIKFLKKKRQKKFI